MRMLDVRDLRVHYGGLAAVRGVSFQLGRGELVALIGSNGAGKSSTLKAIAGLVPCSGGAIRFQDSEIQRLAPEARVQRGVALSPEGRRLFGRMTVLENLLVGAHTVGSSAEREESLKHVYALFPRVHERRSQLAGSLSGGEQQMVAIGRALMARPRLILFDEPSLGLAPTVVETTFAVIADIRRQGTTVLMVEQNAHLALQMADRGYVMETGRIVLAGAARDLMTNDHVRRAYLGG
jgi:branched-chain amino acid transport system ATP-binding protein